MKIRLDQLLLRENLVDTIDAARGMICAGEVFIDDVLADKPGLLFDPSVVIRLKEKCSYASRGGLKLAEGLTTFGISVADLVCIDIGASTGGFTDCLLQQGAQKVYAVDVAYGQLAWKLRQDPRVTVLERFNARHITPESLNNESVDFAVLDVSFISLTTLIPPVLKLFSREVSLLALIKPQFELPRDDVGPGGIITSPSLHDKAIAKICAFATQNGLQVGGTVPSPILGPKGNREFLIHIISG